MSVRERTFLLTSPEEVDLFLERFPTGIVFKAGSCHKTMEGFSHLESHLLTRPQLHVGFIRVVESRPASNHVAEKTGITHESPQVILFIKGEAVFDVDNWEITPESLKKGLERHLGPAEEISAAPIGSDLTSYIDLLEALVEGELQEGHFKMRWLETFRDDAGCRSTEEVELLSSLYGDVDAALVGIGGGPSIKNRAEQLLCELRAKDD